MQILKYMLGVMLVLLAASPSFAYTTLDDLKFGEYKNCFIDADESESGSGNCLEDTLKSLKPGMWGVPGLDDKTQVDIIGNSVCVGYRGKQNEGEAADNQSYFDKPSDGGVCYCQMTGPETSSWMFGSEYKDYKDCNHYCAEECAKYIMVDYSEIRTNMFATVDYGGGSSGGDDYSWLYDTTGTGNMCFVPPADKFTDYGCPSGTDKIITEPRQWAAVLDSKEHPETIVTGTAWVSDVIDTNEPNVGYIPTDSMQIDKINKEYESYKAGDNPYGSYCYCKMETPDESSWVLLSDQGLDLKFCIRDCANITSKRGAGSEQTTLTDAMFSTLKSAAGGMSMVVTTRKYVDDLLNTKQARITTIGTNKLMTYGSSAGNIGTRNIVSTLSGASTSATTVPEVGPIVAAMGVKQNQLSDMANYVVMGTGTAGFVGRKPIYTATNNYDTSLVTAQTINTVAATAANSELSCTRYVDGAAQTDANCLLWGINTTAPAGTLTFMSFNPDVSIDGTSYCYRRLNGIAGDNGTCGADTLSYLGADGNKSGKWGIVFPYGDVSGKSVCSAVSASTTGTIATDAQSETLDSEYAAQVGVGESALATNQTRCWCKMENPAGSPWVYNTNYNDDRFPCAPNCASVCSTRAVGGNAFRSAMFGSVTQ